jgi:hypothetical protein
MIALEQDPDEMPNADPRRGEPSRPPARDEDGDDAWDDEDFEDWLFL